MIVISNSCISFRTSARRPDLQMVHIFHCSTGQTLRMGTPGLVFENSDRAMGEVVALFGDELTIMIRFNMFYTNNRANEMVL